MTIQHPNMDIDYLVQCLRENGVVAFEGLYHHYRENFLAEHERLCAPDSVLADNAERLDGEYIVPSSPKRLMELDCPALAQVLAPPWFSDLGRAYFNAAHPTPVSFISLALDHEKSDLNISGNHLIHWDPSLTLRLMLYVTDVDRTNGAIEVIRRTHFQNHEQRLKEWKEGIEYSDTPVCAGLSQPFEALEGRAGTVLVFDTSVTHRRGLLDRGTTRRVGFGHIHSDLSYKQLGQAPFSELRPEELYPHGFVHEGHK